MMTIFPDAPVFTMFADTQSLPESIRRRKIITPKFWGDKFAWRKPLLPILPRIIESMNFSEYDLILSSSSCVAKGAIKAQGAKHISYVHSPMRYIWDQKHEYLRTFRSLPLGEMLVEAVLEPLRTWDVESAKRVDSFIANSTFVSERISRYYHRDSVVITPPIEDRFFETPLIPTSQREDYFLAFGAWVTYKRFDLAIAACEKLGKRLIVAGSGPCGRELKAMAGQNTTFVESPSDADVLRLISHANALIFPGIEDFGMVPVECVAMGTPVIALQRGGLLDSMSPPLTGTWFSEQSVDHVAFALDKFRIDNYDVEALRQHARSFGRASFINKIRTHIESVLGTKV
jgi:glycosyltransferase involved in cell wall biosynthesis